MRVRLCEDKEDKEKVEEEDSILILNRFQLIPSKFVLHNTARLLEI